MDSLTAPDVDLDDSVASTELVPQDADLTSPDGAETESETAAPAELEADSPAAEQPPGETLPDQLVFPTGGTPFSFRVDGMRDAVTPDGAVQYADGSVLLPAKAWDTVRGGYLADRGAWSQKERTYQQQVREAREHRGQSEVRSEKILAEWGKVLAGGPDAVLAWVEDFERNKPILEARIEAQMAQAELERYRAGEAATQQQQAAENLVPTLQGHLDTAVNHYLDGAFKGVVKGAQERNELRQFLWDTMAGQLFYEDERGIGFRTDILEQFLKREQGRIQRNAESTKKVTQAAKINAAAVQPTRGTKTAKPAATTPTKPIRLDPDDEIAKRDYLS